ncbi:TPA: response regulator, partial [bacterium]|nr:response regulator [bacterium]
MANILIVDDEESIRDVFATFLNIYQHKVTIAKSGEEAINLIEKNIFDIVITDLKMGKVDGMTVLNSIKEISPDTEVIMVTAFATIPIAVQAMGLGAYDFVSKPVNLDELKLT